MCWLHLLSLSLNLNLGLSRRRHCRRRRHTASTTSSRRRLRRSRPHKEPRNGIVDVHPIGNVLQAQGLRGALDRFGLALLEGPGGLDVGLALHHLVAQQDHLGHGIVKVVPARHLVQLRPR